VDKSRVEHVGASCENLDESFKLINYKVNSDMSI